MKKVLSKTKVSTKEIFKKILSKTKVYYGKTISFGFSAYNGFMKTKLAQVNTGMVCANGIVAQIDALGLKDRNRNIEKIDLSFFLNSCFDKLESGSSWAFEIIFDTPDAKGYTRYVFFDNDFPSPLYVLGVDRTELMSRPGTMVLGLNQRDSSEVVQRLFEEKL